MRWKRADGPRTDRHRGNPGQLCGRASVAHGARWPRLRCSSWRGAGFGVAAATGNEPVRGLLGISNSVIGVEFEGVVVDVQPGALRIDANGDLRIVTVDANTDITRSGEVVAFDAIAPAMTVEVHGRLLSDNTILATRVNLEDDLDASPTAGAPTEAVPTATAAVPTSMTMHGGGDRTGR